MYSLLGLVLGLLLAMPVSADTPRLITPQDGAIREVLLTLPEDDFTNGEPSAVLREALVGVVHALGPNVRYLVHAYPERERVITALMHRQGAQALQFLPSAHGHYTRWPQDMMLVQRNGSSYFWLASRALMRRLDSSVAPEIGQQLGQTVQTMDGEIAGGNLVVSGVWVFAGEDLLGGDEGDHELARRNAVRKLLAPDQHWHWVAMHNMQTNRAIWQGTRQPLFHLDMLLTALAPVSDAKPVLLIASPRLARQLLGKSPRIQDHDDEYDAFAATLVLSGFTVVRLPMMIESQATDTLLLGYNNVLLEESDSTKRAFIPRYGGALAILDDYAERVYQQQGYKVVWVAGPWRTLARDLGGLRCLVLVTNRSPIIK